jgi:hypothetical protein
MAAQCKRGISRVDFVKSKKNLEEWKFKRLCDVDSDQFMENIPSSLSLEATRFFAGILRAVDRSLRV